MGRRVLPVPSLFDCDASIFIIRISFHQVHAVMDRVGASLFAGT
jgi:hypothetical protein